MSLKLFILVISSLGIVQALLLCIYLFTLKDKRTNIFLALTILGLTIRIGKSILLTHMPLDPWIRNLGISGLLLSGPFLWFYGRALFEKTDFPGRNYLHLIPFALFIFLSGIIPNRGDFASYFIYSLVFVHTLAYLIFSWLHVSKNSGARLLPWYRTIVTGVSIIWFLFVGIFVGIIPFYILGAIFFSFLIYVFSYLLLKRHVFTLEKYSNTAVDPLTAKKLLQQIKALFESGEIYLQSGVSLKEVARVVAASPREVSQVINEYEQKNFSEFVNQYRIIKAKALLADPARTREKIESIAFDCGFGNVTSFNTAFKAETQMTPSQYRNRFTAL